MANKKLVGVQIHMKIIGFLGQTITNQVIRTDRLSSYGMHLRSSLLFGTSVDDDGA